MQGSYWDKKEVKMEHRSGKTKKKKTPQTSTLALSVTKEKEKQLQDQVKQQDVLDSNTKLSDGVRGHTVRLSHSLRHVPHKSVVGAIPLRIAECNRDAVGQQPPLRGDAGVAHRLSIRTRRRQGRLTEQEKEVGDGSPVQAWFLRKHAAQSSATSAQPSSCCRPFCSYLRS